MLSVTTRGKKVRTNNFKDRTGQKDRKKVDHPRKFNHQRKIVNHLSIMTATLFLNRVEAGEAAL
jgi:hypothetical protein